MDVVISSEVAAGWAAATNHGPKKAPSFVLQSDAVHVLETLLDALVEHDVDRDIEPIPDHTSSTVESCPSW